MIRYTLRCPVGHDFESWFQNAAAFDTLTATGRVTCPSCGAGKVAKAPMAPNVQASDKTNLSRPATKAETALAALRQHVEQNSDYVGSEFAAKARAMHDGLIPDRAIHGEARLDEARALVEDGVPVAPLPFMPARKVN